MAISLTKGQAINLSKGSNDLSSVTVGLGWKVKQKGFFSKFAKAADFDLDAVAFLLDERGKILNVGNEELVGGDVVFFNNLRHASGHVTHSGDNLVGGSGAEDNEQIVVNLDRLDSRYKKIVFLVSIYEGVQRGQHFGEVEEAFIRAVNVKGEEIARYDLVGDSSFDTSRTLIFGAFYRKDGVWKFRAVGEGSPTDSFAEVVDTYA